MDEILYSSLSRYFSALEVKGYMPYSQMEELMILCFYRDFVFSDYRGILSKDDYLLIERALDCLYGSSCLIPYPDYLKMGKLHLGETTEIAARLKTLEETEVLKPSDLAGSSLSDIVILEGED